MKGATADPSVNTKRAPNNTKKKICVVVYYKNVFVAVIYYANN